MSRACGIEKCYADFEIENIRYIPTIICIIIQLVGWGVELLKTKSLFVKIISNLC